MGRKRFAVVLIGCLLALTLPAWAGDAIIVRSTRANEVRPVAASGYIGWMQSSRSNPDHYDAYIKPDGEARIRVNADGINGAMGGIDGTTLVYQQYKGAFRRFLETGRGRSDIKFFDLAARQRSSPPDGVNTDGWEYWPSRSGDWLLFARGTRRTTRVLLHNLVDGSTLTLLRQENDGRRVFPGVGQVNGDYAVYDACNRRGTNCNVYRHTISTSTTVKIPKPDRAKWQIAPSVTPGGTVYFERTGSSCNARYKLVRFPLGGPGTTILTGPRGWDSLGTYAYVTPEGATEVFFDRYNACGPGAGDIFKVIDTAVTLTSERSTTVSSSGGGSQHLSGDEQVRPLKGPMSRSRHRAAPRR